MNRTHTLVILCLTIVCVTVLTALDKPVPAAVSGLLGAVLTAALPSLLGGPEAKP